jgi:hypothetical protein
MVWCRGGASRGGENRYGPEVVLRGVPSTRRRSTSCPKLSVPLALPPADRLLSLWEVVWPWRVASSESGAWETRRAGVAASKSSIVATWRAAVAGMTSERRGGRLPNVAMAGGRCLRQTPFHRLARTCRHCTLLVRVINARCSSRVSPRAVTMSPR